MYRSKCAMNLTSTILLVGVFSLFLPMFTVAQNAISLGSQRAAATVTTTATYQRYEDDGTYFEQVSLPVTVAVPVGREFGFVLRAAPALARGRDLDQISGVGDVQLGTTYSRVLGPLSLVASIRANVPSGKSTLNPEEFQTSSTLSKHYYDFEVPIFGQGVNLGPGLVVAIPITPSLVVGLGAAYQYKSSFQPRSLVEGDYDPGDELVLTGGLDARVSESSRVSADLTLTQYTDDTIDGSVVISSGNRIGMTALLQSFIGRDEFVVMATHRRKASSSVPSGALITTPGEVRSIPNKTEAQLSYRIHVSDATSFGLLVSGRYFGETDSFGSRTIFNVGVAPQHRVSSKLTLATGFGYAFGSVTGLEARFGLRFTS